MSSAAGFPVSFFGLFTLPDIVEPDNRLKIDMMDVHETLAWFLVGMIVLHIIAALSHHFYYKNNVLRRMLPFSKEEKYAQDSDTMVGC
jgi:cytochrome b561